MCLCFTEGKKERIKDLGRRQTVKVCATLMALDMVHLLTVLLVLLCSSGLRAEEIHDVNDSVRLVNGTSWCSGRLEVKSNQRWSSVCEADFDLQDAEVVCRELGCGAPSVLQGALYGEVEAPVWTKEFQCGGHESALLDCRSSDSARNTCSPGKAVGLTCSEPVRLVGGDSRCSGALEMKHLNEWRPVFDSHWTMKEAAVICRELDCASSSFIMEITCSDSVRLQNGNPCSGRLEVKSNQQWSPVCEDDFDQQDAEVVCRELGCGAPLVLQGALYGEVEAPVWTKEFQCGGNESALLDCRSSDSTRNTCSAGKAVGLTCSEPLRLVGGSSRCSGTLEIKQGEWRPVYSSYSDWTLKDAAVFCKKLECGSVVSMEWLKEPSVRSVWQIRTECLHSGSALTDCVRPELSNAVLGLTCLDSVRLINGTSLCSGRLEVKSNQRWSSVCEADFDQQDAEVVCREIGCGAPLVLQGALYGEVEAPVWTKEFQCGGNESALLDCRSSDSARHTCSPGKAVGLTCSAPLRLVGEYSHCSGKVEIKHDKEWRPLAIPSNEDPDVMCRELDCGPSERGKRVGSHASSSTVKYTIANNLLEAKSGEPFRLVGGSGPCNGALEVKHGEDWRPASASDWTLKEAAGFCKKLDCGSAVSIESRKESSVRSVWALTSECVNSGSALRSCVRSDSSSNILEITCSGRPYRLVGGSSRCSGILEVKHGEWRPVYTSYWSKEDKDWFCKKLECGSAASSTDRKKQSSFKSVWEISSECVQSGPAMMECLKPGSTSIILELTCSDEE
ncbi:scavenger receptor cysteine-rich type 1 protein M160-like [Symphorus nematophorus]